MRFLYGLPIYPTSQDMVFIWTAHLPPVSARKINFFCYAVAFWFISLPKFD